MSEKNNTEGSNQVFTEDKKEVDLPKLFKVILHNDDYTPMDFVVEILIEVFRKDELSATRIMLNVHNQGRGICGVFTYEIAETKVEIVHKLAEQNEYPLHASMEAE